GDDVLVPLDVRREVGFRIAEPGGQLVHAAAAIFRVLIGTGAAGQARDAGFVRVRVARGQAVRQVHDVILLTAVIDRRLVARLVVLPPRAGDAGAIGQGTVVHLRTGEVQGGL